MIFSLNKGIAVNSYYIYLNKCITINMYYTLKLGIVKGTVQIREISNHVYMHLKFL